MENKGDASLKNAAGPSLETAFDANKLNVISLTRRGDTDGTPASLETETYSDFVHDSLGRTTRGPDANWYPADTQYDALDRPIKSPDGRGHQWDTVFDANGNPLMVGLTVNGAYLDGYYAAWDDLDRIERRVDYAGNATLTQYNPIGHVTRVTEADGYSIGFETKGTLPLKMRPAPASKPRLMPTTTNKQMGSNTIFSC